MSIYSEIKQAFPSLPIADISDYYTNEIEYAKRIYQGSPPWARVKSSGLKQKTRKRALTGMAKVVCDKMAALTFSEQCDIECAEYQKVIEQTLAANSFNSKFPEWLSRAFALGGGVIKVNIIGREIKLDYLNADVFFPTKWDNRHITGGIFRTTMAAGKYHYTIFENVDAAKNGLTIEHSVFRSDSKRSLGTPVNIGEVLPDTAQKTIFGGIKIPLFTYFKPAIGNNKCFDLPLGIPIFANCYDTLEEIDVIFDSLQREFILGKKRIMLPEQFVQLVTGIDGEQHRYFDVDDEIYQAFMGDSEKLGITDISVQLRVQEHCDALNYLLNMLASQLGLSVGSLSFDKSDGLKTATEVVANERDTMRTVENQKNIITECIKELCESIIAAHCWINNREPVEHSVSVQWQDNVIADDDTRIQRNIELVNAGLRSRIKALTDINGYDDESAAKELDAISREQPSGGGALDNLFGGNE